MTPDRRADAALPRHGGAQARLRAPARERALRHGAALDTYDEIVLAAGKEIADVVLARVGKLLVSKVRVEDSVARTAQATFMVLAAATGAAQMLAGAAPAARACRREVSYRDRPLKFAASASLRSPSVLWLHRGADARACAVAQTADAARPPKPAVGCHLMSRRRSGSWNERTGPAPGAAAADPEETQADHRRVTLIHGHLPRVPPPFHR